ncbi:T9SS type A sorting domain-containing protein [Bacteroidota bacterium]
MIKYLYDYFPCDISVDEQGTSYTRDEIDPDTVIIEIDKVIDTYAYDKDSITSYNMTQWGFDDCNGCWSKRLITYYLNTHEESNIQSINKNSKNNSAHLFPNPAFTYTNLFLENYNNATVYIYNLNGKLMLTTEISKGNNIILTGDLTKGIYLLDVVKNNNTISRLKLYIQ